MYDRRPSMPQLCCSTVIFLPTVLVPVSTSSIAAPSSPTSLLRGFPNIRCVISVSARPCFIPSASCGSLSVTLAYKTLVCSPVPPLPRDISAICWSQCNCSLPDLAIPRSSYWNSPALFWPSCTLSFLRPIHLTLISENGNCSSLLHTL